MARKLVALLCLLTLLWALPASAYKRDASFPDQEESSEEPAEQPASVSPPSFGVSGSHVAGYLMIGVGGAAAIAGSTIVATTHKNVLGASIGAGGAVLSLVGSLLLMMTPSGYALAPQIDPEHQSYGLAVAANF